MLIPAYTIKPSSRCKTLSLHVYPSGNVIVKAPENYDPEEVRRYVTAQAGWIKKQQRIFFSKQNLAKNYSVTIGDRIVPYTITYHSRRKNISIICHPDGRFEVRAPWDATVDSVIAMVGRHKDWIRQTLEGHHESKSPSIPEGYEGSLQYNGKAIAYTVLFSPRAKRITIKVKQDRSIKVISPAGANREQIRHLVEKKADWIYTQVTSEKRAVAVRRAFCDGEKYPFLGGTLTVMVRRGGTKATAVRNGQTIEVCLPAGMPQSAEQKIIRRAVEFIIKDETHRAVIPRVMHYSAALDVKVPPVYVRKNKGKWGFCTSRGKVTFASELCLLPPRLFDYVVAHECCHLVVMNHSDRFWNTFKAVMPDCHERQRELKRDSPLYRIFMD